VQDRDEPLSLLIFDLTSSLPIAFALDMFGSGYYTLPLERRQAPSLFPTRIERITQIYAPLFFGSRWRKDSIAWKMIGRQS